MPPLSSVLRHASRPYDHMLHNTYYWRDAALTTLLVFFVWINVKFEAMSVHLNIYLINRILRSLSFDTQFMAKSSFIRLK